VINQGENGQPAARTVEVIRDTVSADRPDVVLVLTGYNNMLGGSQSPRRHRIQPNPTTGFRGPSARRRGRSLNQEGWLHNVDARDFCRATVRTRLWQTRVSLAKERRPR
jgi:hypothetical protein